MEVACFSSSRSGRRDSGRQGEKVADGLAFPIYVLTASFNSPSIDRIQKFMEGEFITLSFQQSTHSLSRIANTHHARYFIILNELPSPSLQGEFRTLSCLIAPFPALTLQRILAEYRSFVEQEKTAIFEKRIITEGEHVILSAQKQKKQNICCEGEARTAEIQLRRISKTSYNYKSSFPKKLFVYSNGRDDAFYLACLKAMEGYCIEGSEHITKIEDYLRLTSEKDEVRFYLLMSEYSAVNLRKFFKKCDDIIVCTSNYDACIPLLRGKVGHIICDVNTLTAMMVKAFNATFKCNNSEEQYLAAQKCNSMKISQQFSLVSQARKNLQFQSSTIQVTITPAESWACQPSSITISEFQAISPIREREQDTSPLKIVHLKPITVSQPAPHINIFTEVINSCSPRTDKCAKPLTNKSKLSGENLLQSGSLWSSSSRCSQRTNRNSRIIERFKGSSKANN